MPRLSEQRARTVTRELLRFRGWDVRPLSSGGQLLEEAEYRYYPALVDIFQGQSKSGPGYGKPDFLLVGSSNNLRSRIVIDTKPSVSQLKESVRDSNHYGNALYKAGHEVLSVAVAGAEKEVCEVLAQRRINSRWRDLKLHGKSIDWIPSPSQTSAILTEERRIEVEPELPPESVLASQANRLNEILRECGIKDEFRPIYVATYMLGLWFADVTIDPDAVLGQINANAKRALQKARKQQLSDSLRVDTKNQELASRSWEIIDILKKLNIRSFMEEHDYLGQLYETFFRYTGGNTIGQYFTPRHIIKLMCILVDVRPKDIVFDPACGTGGFLIGALNRMIQLQNFPYKEAIRRARKNLYGIEKEPTTAALCIANMILRGDGKTGVIRDNCFTKQNYPPMPASCALLNPPFPDKKTDVPPIKFIDRALDGVADKGLVASVVPYSLLLKITDWHRRILKQHRLIFVATMPADLFQPYSQFNTAIIVIQKGVPHNNRSVFFARLTNDGYKLKKKTRIPREGSQISDLLRAFDRKKETPEFTAYRTVTPDEKEWSPEAFLDSAPRKDRELINGFEQSIRSQAAFYIEHGHSLVDPDLIAGVQHSAEAFAHKSSVSLAGVNVGQFKVSDYFSIMLGGKQEIEDLGDEPDYPIISTSQSNNGLTTWKRPDITYHPGAITVATDGSICSSFVQEFPFYAFYKVAILRPLPNTQIPIDALYFVAYLLSRERWRYVYARKFGKTRIASTTLSGPIKRGKPDFDKMAELARQCRTFGVIASFRTAFAKSAKQRFGSLVGQWKKHHQATSSARKMAEDPAYRKIIEMGEVALPLILRELKRDPDHWFIALHEITGANPVPKVSQGKLREMAQAWFSWGKEQGYIT